MERKKYIIWGIGQCYRDYMTYFVAMMNFVYNAAFYVYDKKLNSGCEGKKWGLFPIITQTELQQIRDFVVFINLYDFREANEVRRLAENYGALETHLTAFECAREINGLDLIKSGGYYADCFGNNVIFDSTVPRNILIKFKGIGNRIEIQNGVQVHDKLKIIVGSNANVIIGKESSFISTYIRATLGRIAIGTDCMFAHDTEVMNSDGHHIFDAKSGLRLNKEKDVMIGDHVWVGARTTILKGSVIGEGSVIGSGATVSGEVDARSISVGTPASVIRKDIIWERNSTDLYDIDNIQKL